MIAPFSMKGGEKMRKKSNEKRTKEKIHMTIPKVLHKLIDIFKLLYELCVWVKAIIKLFF